MARKSNDTSKSEYERVYAYHGADDYQKKAALVRLKAELVAPGLEDFDYEELYGPDVTADRLIIAASVAPFMSKRRLVVVTQAHDIPASEQQVIAGKLGSIPESSCVVFTSPAPIINDGKVKRGSEISADIMKAIKKAGKAVDFPLMKPEPAAHFVNDLLKQAGKSISPTIAATIVRRCGTDSGVLSSEIEKLINYTGDRSTVTDADVQQVVTQTIEEKIFALMDAVGSKKPDQAVQYLRPLFQGGADAQSEVLRTLTMLARHFRHLWQVRLLLDAGYRMVPSGLSGELASAFPQNGSIMKMEDWKRTKLFAQARNFSLNELVQCFEKITAVDLAMKGIEGAIGDPARGLEVLIIELSSLQKSNKGRA